MLFVTTAALAQEGDKAQSPDAAAAAAADEVPATEPAEEGAAPEQPNTTDTSELDESTGGAGAAAEPEAEATHATAPASQPSAEEDLLPRHRIVYESLAATRLNPLGLEERVSLGYQLRLWDNPGILYRDAYFGLVLTPTFSPSILRLGGGVQFKPLAVLLLAANAYWTEWLGTYGYLQSYASPNAPHSDSDIDRGEELGLHYKTSGLEVELQALLQAKVGPVALANDLRFFYHDLDLQGRDTVFYDIRIDTLSPNQGWALTNDTNLVWISDFGLVLGVRGTVTYALYEDKHFLFGENQDVNDNVPSFRIGPIAALVLSDDGQRSAFSKPTLIVMVNWWVKHPYRTGQDVSQAYPYVVLGFKFGGELWASQP